MEAQRLVYEIPEMRVLRIEPSEFGEEVAGPYGVWLCISLVHVKHSRVLVIAFCFLGVGQCWVEMSLLQA